MNQQSFSAERRLSNNAFPRSDTRFNLLLKLPLKNKDWGNEDDWVNVSNKKTFVTSLGLDLEGVRTDTLLRKSKRASVHGSRNNPGHPM